MNSKTITTYGHWVYDNRLPEYSAVNLIVTDFATKCANILAEYADYRNLKLSLGIYQLLDKRYGIDGWVADEYEHIGRCHGNDDNIKYSLYSIIRIRLQEILGPHYVQLSDKELHSILGAGEFPFLDVYERLDGDGNYHYIYTISR